jgi:hypothetical protein
VQGSAANRGIGQYASQDLHIILPIVFGLVTLVAFGFWEYRMGDRALMPPRLFKGKTRDFTLPIVVSQILASTSCH